MASIDTIVCLSANSAGIGYHGLINVHLPKLLIRLCRLRSGRCFHCSHYIVLLERRRFHGDMDKHKTHSEIIADRGSTQKARQIAEGTSSEV